MNRIPHSGRKCKIRKKEGTYFDVPLQAKLNTIAKQTEHRFMTYDPNIHHRRSIRLKCYDYSKKGLYYLTLCVQNKIHLFGKVESERMELNDAGQMVQFWWQEIPQKYSQVILHEYVVMPNHFHGVLQITEQDSSTIIGDVIRWYKIKTTNHYIEEVKLKNWQRFEGKLWQRNYYEHIVRDAEDYHHIVEYIDQNPSRWSTDQYYIKEVLR